MSIELSIIIPAYNEANAIRAGKLDRVIHWAAAQPFTAEVLVIDDGSLDETAALAGQSHAMVMTIPHGGKAAAIAAGIRAAAGRVILFTDMDQATPISEAPRLLAHLAGAEGVAIGSRGAARKGAPVWRYLLSWGQVALRRLIIGLAITDTQCGFKAFTRQAAVRILDHMQVYRPERAGRVSGPSVTSGFDVEFLFVACRLGYPVHEVRVQWDYQETRRVRLFRDAGRGLADLFRIALASLQGRYPRERVQPIN